MPGSSPGGAWLAGAIGTGATSRLPRFKPIRLTKRGERRDWEGWRWRGGVGVSREQTQTERQEDQCQSGGGGGDGGRGDHLLRWRLPPNLITLRVLPSHACVITLGGAQPPPPHPTLTTPDTHR